MALPRKHQAFKAYISSDGSDPTPLPGIVAEFEPPTKKRTTQDYRAGDMLGKRKVNFGEEQREATIVFEDLPDELVKQWADCGNSPIRLRVVSSEEVDYCDVSQHEYVMDGYWDEIKTEKLQAGEKTNHTCKLEVEIYAEYRDGEELEFWDKELSIHRVGGEDMTAKRRKALELPY